MGVDTIKAREGIDAAERQLRDWGNDKAEALLGVDGLAKFRADIEIAKAELDTVPRRRNVIMDVDSSLTTKLGAIGGAFRGARFEADRLDARGNFLTRTFRGITTAFRDAGGVTGIFQGALAGVGGAMPIVGGATGITSSALQLFGVSEEAAGAAGGALSLVLAGVLLTAVVALTAAIVAMASSLIIAIAAIGGMATALGALLLPVLGLVIGAIARFKDQADQAGTAANKLKTAAGDFGKVAKQAFGPGLDAALRGAAGGIKALSPLVRSLKAPFTEFGRAVGTALTTIGREFAKPAWSSFFTQLLKAAAAITPVMTRVFLGFAAILRNVASAAMPFLLRGMRALSGALDGLARGPLSKDSLRKFFAGAMPALKAWGQLFGGVFRIFGALIGLSAGPGTGLVKMLADGANSLADWMKSAKGSKEIKKFFDDMLPVAKQAAILIGQIVVVVLQLAQAFAPIAGPILQGLNVLLGIIRFLLSYFNKLPGPIKLVIGALLLLWLSSGIGTFLIALALVARFFPQIKAAAIAVFNALKTAIRAWVNVAKLEIRVLLAYFRFVFNTIRTVVKAVFNALKAAVKLWVNVAKLEIRVVLAVFRSVFNTIRSVATSVWGAVKNAAIRAFGPIKAGIHSIREAFSNAFNGIRGIASSVWNAVKKVITAPFSFHITIPAIHIHAGLGPLPDLNVDAGPWHFAKGVRGLAQSTLGLLGELGPELAFLPQGTDVFTARETRNILRGLADGKKTSSGGSVFHQHFDIAGVPGTGQPDPEVLVARISQKLRTAGALG